MCVLMKDVRFFEGFFLRVVGAAVAFAIVVVI
jgi:hypothetical protein